MSGKNQGEVIDIFVTSGKFLLMKINQKTLHTKHSQCFLKTLFLQRKYERNQFSSIQSFLIELKTNRICKQLVLQYLLCLTILNRGISILLNIFIAGIQAPIELGFRYDMIVIDIEKLE